MEDIFQYKDRDQFYKFLIEDFGFKKVDEKYYAKAFGNFYILLSSNKFLLQYIKDRLFLTIQIASLFEPSNWHDLAFIKNYIYNPDVINAENQDIFSRERFDELNSFLKTDFELISNLFDKENFKNTQIKIDHLLRQKFIQEHPGSLDSN